MLKAEKSITSKQTIPGRELLATALGSDSLLLMGKLTTVLNNYFQEHSIKVNEATAENIIEKIFFETKTYNQESAVKKIKDFFLDNPRIDIPQKSYLQFIETLSLAIYYSLVHHESIEEVRLNPDAEYIKNKLQEEMKCWKNLKELLQELSQTLPK